MKQDQAIALCEDIILYATKLASAGKQKEKYIVYDSCISFCNRTRINIVSIRALLPVYFQNKELEFSIGVLLRNNLLDHLIINYLMHKKENLLIELKNKHIDTAQYKIQLENEFSRLQNDHLKSILSYAKMQCTLNIKDKDQWDLVMQNLTTKYNLPKDWESIKKFPQARQLFEKSYQNPATKESAFLSYDLYSLYSKYEHFGFFSDELLWQPQNIQRMKHSLLISCLTILEAANFMNEISLAKEIDQKLIAHGND